MLITNIKMIMACMFSLILTFVFTSTVSAKTLDFAVQSGTFSTISSVSDTSSSMVGVVSQNNSSTTTNGWRAETAPDIILIPNGDIITPVMIGADVTLIHDQHGRVNVAGGKVRAAIRVPVVEFDPQQTSFTKRSTLFISLCGASGSISLDGRGNCPLQTDLDSRIRSHAMPLNLPMRYQFKHFMVDWDTHQPTRYQVDDLADVVKDFLNTRSDAWDVVIVGFSRGGIFAHELTGKIAGHAKLAKLYTHLLDPTASALFQDTYPQALNFIVPSNFYGHFYYDDNAFQMEGTVPLPGGTTSDIPIPGYTSQYIAATHTTFLDEWFVIAEGLPNTLSSQYNNKDAGYFPRDGKSGTEIVRITYPSGVVFDGTIEVVNGQVHVAGNVTIGVIPGDSTSFDMQVGATRAEASVAVAAATAHLLISHDEASISSSTAFEDISASINSEGLSTNVAILNLEVGVNTGWDGSISIDLGDIHLSLDITQAISDFANGVGDVFNDLGDTIADVFGW